MRRPTLLLAALLALAACGGEAPPSPAAGDDMTAADAASVAIGDAVPSGEALSPEEVAAQADALDGKTVTVEGTVRDVCQQAGCWLAFAGADGQTVRVDVPRDESESYAFTFPKDLSGATVRVAGMLEVTTESVADQRHHARDGRASEAEVEAITEPAQVLVLTAIGLEVLDRPAPSAS